MSNKFPFSILLCFERDSPISPEEAKALLDRICIPMTEHLEYFKFEPEYEWNAVSDIIEDRNLDEAEAALTTAECIWGQTPDSVRLSTRISRIRILGK